MQRDTVIVLGAVAVFVLGRSGTARALSVKSKESSSGEDALVARANQSRARYWAGEFTAFPGVSAEYSRALSRWAGIESGGDPLALSPIGERGLLQSTRTTALQEGAFTPAEWAELQDRNTMATRHADLAVRFARWIWARARRHVKNPPTDDASIAWYSKLYHARPRDLVLANASGEALAVARRLESEWRDDPKALHRLHAANVVAWGVIRP
jgi:hypothetical protein